jgi:succinate--hydroxymethylglutarate CoA-transferase
MAKSSKILEGLVSLMVLAVLARGMVQEVEHPLCGPIKLVNTPVKYSESKPGIRTPPPVLGQHTDEILRDTLKMTEADIGDLRSEGVIA